MGEAPPSTREIFLAFFKVGALSFGGVYSMLSFFDREFVEKRGWVSRAEYTEGVAIGQMTPGPPIINTGVYIGYRLRGARGAAAATAGLVLPGFVLVLLLGYLYVMHSEKVFMRPVLKGVGAAVVGLLLSVVLKMSRESLRRLTDWGIALCAFAALLVFHVNPILLLVAAGASGWLVYRRAGRGDDAGI